MYTAIFVSLFVLGWLACAYLPWLVVSLRTRGEAGLKYLPLCLFAGVVGALAVPLLINDGWTGLWLSFVMAAAVPAALLGIRRLTAAGVETPADAAERGPAMQTAEPSDSPIPGPQSKIRNR